MPVHRHISRLSAVAAVMAAILMLASPPARAVQDFAAVGLQPHLRDGTASVEDDVVMAFVSDQLEDYAASYGVDVQDIRAVPETNSITGVLFIPDAVLQDYVGTVGVPLIFLKPGIAAQLESQLTTQLQDLPYVAPGGVVHLASVFGGISGTGTIPLTGEPVKIVSAVGTVTGDPGLLPRTVDTRMQVSADGQMLLERTDALTLVDGVATMNFGYVADSGVLTFDLLADATDRVAEANETNNHLTASIEAGGGGDGGDGNHDEIGVLCDSLRAETVRLSSEPDCPVLLELLQQQAVAALATIGELRDLRVYPWASTLPGIDRFFAPGAAFDLAVVAVCGPGPARDRLEAELAGALADLWFVDGAATITATDAWWGAASAPFAADDRLVAVGIDLPATRLSADYWRVEAVIERHAAGAAQAAAPMRVPVLLATWDAGQDTTEAAAMAYPPITADGQARAVGFLPVDPNDDPETISVTVDPFDEIADSNVLDDRCEGEFPVNRLPSASFDVRASVAYAVGADGVARLHVVGRLANPTDRSLRLSFASALQLDFTVNGGYRWSAGRVVPQVTTEVVVAPGATYVWQVWAPVTEIAAALGGRAEIWLVEATLVGAGYSARTTLDDLTPLPLPPAAADMFDAAAPAPDAGNVPPPVTTVENLIAATGTVEMSGLTPSDAAGGAWLVEVVRQPLGGGVTDDGQAVSYAGNSRLPGRDFAVFEVDDGANRIRAVRRISVGPQRFVLHLRAGWNLVSLPVIPYETVAQWLARVPGGFAWTWSGRRYRRLTEFAIGRGFWVYSAADRELAFLGAPRADVFLRLGAGWHLLGTVNGGALPDDLPEHRLIGWAEDVGYFTTTRPRQGTACWFHLAAPARLPMH